MPTRVDEAITVTLSPDGEPRAFVWRRFEYEVLGVPQPFYRRRAWWRDRGDLARIDSELWRVDATPTGVASDSRTFDLARRPDEEGWVLALAWE